MNAIVGSKNADHLAKIYVVGEGDEFFMYFVSKSIPYDFPLTKSHSDFCITLWQTEGIVVHGSQIPDGPPEDLTVYFNPTSAFTLTPM